MAEAFPNSNFYGYDTSKEGIEAAREESRQKGISNAFFETKDASSIDESSKFEFVTAFDTIHDQPKPTKVLQTIHKSLKSNGIFLMQDTAVSSNLQDNISNPVTPILYTFSAMHSMATSIACDGEWPGTLWGKQKAEQKLREAGFFEESIKIFEIPVDILNYYYVARKA